MQISVSSSPQDVLRKRVQRVAIIDAFLALYRVVYRVITLYLKLLSMVNESPFYNRSRSTKSGSQISSSKGTHANFISNSRHLYLSTTQHNFLQDGSNDKAANYSQLTATSSSLSASENLNSQLKKLTVVALLLGALFVFAIEVFLCLLLNNGINSKSRRLCKHWFTMRVVCWVLSFGRSFIDYTLDQYTWMVALFELEKIYRIYTFYLIRIFIKELDRRMVNSFRETRQMQCLQVY